jgi:hypothetical protein
MAFVTLTMAVLSGCRLSFKAASILTFQKCEVEEARTPAQGGHSLGNRKDAWPRQEGSISLVLGLRAGRNFRQQHKPKHHAEEVR